MISHASKVHNKSQHFIKLGYMLNFYGNQQPIELIQDKLTSQYPRFYENCNSRTSRLGGFHDQYSAYFNTKGCLNYKWSHVYRQQFQQTNAQIPLKSILASRSFGQLNKSDNHQNGNRYFKEEGFRKLGFFEQTVYEYAGSCYNQIHIKGVRINFETLLETSKLLVKKHKFLTMSVRSIEDGKAEWAELNELNFNDIQEFIIEDDSQFKSKINELNNQKLDYQNLLLKIYLLQTPSQSVILLGYPHCQGDGLGGMILINDFLTIYNYLRSGNIQALETIETIQPLPNVEDLAFPEGIPEKEQY
ncbi:UNKNOWN [Stylonychia lemnae]|uniref:Condensation domain-containing protein n=1 Tax=Stylonychia lemnae TaxID=5949 RepID=A0A078APX0_STYLE|nr:UNKNOWN [Stylonychia lemnae]|eukprot:CDW84026.1 UNKNOWN [Stylonychia lemnae]